MSTWEWFTWSNVVILGLGAPVVLAFFLKDLRKLLAELTRTPEVGSGNLSQAVAKEEKRENP